jgi:hypothetical protein
VQYYTTVQVSADVDVRFERTPAEVRVTGLQTVRSLALSSYGNFGFRAPDSYEVEFGGFGGPAWGPSDLDRKTTKFDVFSRDWVDYADLLEIARPNAEIELTYTSFGVVTELYSTPTITFFAVGSRTPQAQMPRTGTATFSGIADGYWIDGSTTRRLYGSKATLSADFAAGQVTSRLELRGHGDAFGAFSSAPTSPLGDFVGSGPISGAAFSGSYGTSGGYGGTFVGAFNGPAADEFGLAFQLQGALGQKAFGVAVGKRD